MSNERVPLSDAMRMVFEINSLKNATPATVSRAGILFINESGGLLGLDLSPSDVVNFGEVDFDVGNFYSAILGYR